MSCVLPSGSRRTPRIKSPGKRMSVATQPMMPAGKIMRARNARVFSRLTCVSVFLFALLKRDSSRMSFIGRVVIRKIE